MGAAVVEAAADVAATAGKAVKGTADAVKGGGKAGMRLVSSSTHVGAQGVKTTSQTFEKVGGGIGDMTSKAGAHATNAWGKATKFQNGGNSSFNPLNLGMLLLGIMFIMCGIYNKTPREIVSSLASGKMPSAGGSGSEDDSVPTKGPKVAKDAAKLEHGAENSLPAQAATASGKRAGNWLSDHTGGLIGNPTKGVGKVLNGANDGINKVVFGKDYDTTTTFVHKDPFAKGK